jgi:hypothetical protein
MHYYVHKKYANGNILLTLSTTKTCTFAAKSKTNKYEM